MLKKRIEFPIVELLVIIILLFVLVIFGLPKMLDVGSEARIKTLNATALNISAVNRLLYSRAVINGIQKYDLQNTDILGKDAGVHLVYGELQANEDDLSHYIDSTLFKYSPSEKEGEIRLYFINYQNESCYITYSQAQQILTADGQASIQNATVKIKRTGC